MTESRSVIGNEEVEWGGQKRRITKGPGELLGAMVIFFILTTMEASHIYLYRSIYLSISTSTICLYLHVRIYQII